MAKAVSSLDVFILRFVGSLRFVPRAKAPGSAFVPVLFPFRRLLWKSIRWRLMTSPPVFTTSMSIPLRSAFTTSLSRFEFTRSGSSCPAPVVDPLVAVVVPA